jgi:exopolysaccharide production protein ExoZ
MEDRRISAIQVFRGIAVLGVMLFHCGTVQGRYSISLLKPPEFLKFGQSGVDLFFVISGFVMATVTHGRFGSREQMTRFLYRRGTRIYPAYWFFSLVVLALTLLTPNWLRVSPNLRIDLLSSFLLVPNKLYPIIQVGWSLIHELWFYVVFSVFLLFRENRLVPALLVWAHVLIVINVVFNVDSFLPGVRLICHSHGLEFISGVFTAILLRTQWAQRIPTRVLLLILVDAILLLVIAYKYRALRQVYLTRTLVFAPLYATVLGCCVLLEMRQLLPKMRFLNFVGNISYSAYLSHLLTMSLAAYVLAIVRPNLSGTFGGLVIWSAMIGAALLVGWLGYRFVERPALELSRVLGDRLLTPRTNVAAAEA